jgi:hypothetical protein
MEEEEEDGVI